MAKVIKVGTMKKRQTKQKADTGVVAGHVITTAYSTDNSSTTKSTAHTTSVSKPRSALVMVEKKINTDRTMIAMAAYYKAEKRHFAPGDEVQDWLEAEAELGILR